MNENTRNSIIAELNRRIDILKTDREKHMDNELYYLGEYDSLLSFRNWSVSHF